MADKEVASKIKSAILKLADVLPGELHLWKSGLKGHLGDGQWYYISTLIPQLIAYGERFHSRRYESVDEDDWVEWCAITCAAIELRAALWCVNSAEDGMDENWALDRVDAALESLSET